MKKSKSANMRRVGYSKMENEEESSPGDLGLKQLSPQSNGHTNEGTTIKIEKAEIEIEKDNTEIQLDDEQ